MARASAVTLRLEWTSLPLFAGAAELAAANRSGGLTSNVEHFAGAVRVHSGLSAAERSGALSLIYDPQTSGGLLVAVAAGHGEATTKAFERADVRAWRIGTVVEAVPHIHIDMV